jgi:hypothetical protein
MKILRFALAGLAALWTLGVVIQVIATRGEHEGARGTTNLVARIAAIAICAAITAWLFQWALKKR